MILNTIGLIVLLILSALFSATETAFTSLSVVQIEQLVQSRGRRGRMVKTLMGNPKLLLSTILIGNNMANVGASFLTATITLQHFGSALVGLTAALLTLIILIFAEVAPKSIAIENNESIALATAYPLRGISLVLTPIAGLVSVISSTITRLFTKQTTPDVTVDGLLHMMKLARRLGVVEEYETRLVQGVFRFADVTAGAIMTHRADVFSLNETLSLSEAIEPINERGFARIPIYREDPEKISGVVLAWQVVIAVLEGKGDSPLASLALEPIFIPSSLKLKELFLRFSSSHINLAVVIDAYGGVAGVVSREDIIEELVGELYDENETVLGEKITQLSPTSYRIQGDTSLHQLKDLIDLPLPQGGRAKTVAGYLVEHLRRIPSKGEEIPIPGAIVTVERIERNRIVSVVCTSTKEGVEE